MKTTQAKNSARSATCASRASKPADKNTALVSISTAEKIGHLAEYRKLPPAVIAGALVEIGLELLNLEDRAKLAGTDWNQLMMQVIKKTLPKPKCVVPVLTTEYAGEASHSWIKDLSRPLDGWLGQMIEIGVQHYYKPALMRSLLPCAEEAYFVTMASRIKEDNDCPAAAELLRPAPAAPPAFISFERVLAAKKGGEE